MQINNNNILQYSSVGSTKSIAVPMNATTPCSCDLGPLKYINFVLDALNNKLCDAANSVHVFNITFNAMFVGANSVTSSA